MHDHAFITLSSVTSSGFISDVVSGMNFTSVSWDRMAFRDLHRHKRYAVAEYLRYFVMIIMGYRLGLSRIGFGDIIGVLINEHFGSAYS